jgi:hypothetical protein
MRLAGNTMKITKGFISNSSSTSFLAWGVLLTKEDEERIPSDIYDILSEYEEQTGHRHPINLLYTGQYLVTAHDSFVDLGEGWSIPTMVITELEINPEWQEVIEEWLEKYGIDTTYYAHKYSWIIGATEG